MRRDKSTPPKGDWSGGGLVMVPRRLASTHIRAPTHAHATPGTLSPLPHLRAGNVGLHSVGITLKCIHSRPAQEGRAQQPRKAAFLLSSFQSKYFTYLIFKCVIARGGACNEMPQYVIFEELEAAVAYWAC